MTAVTRAHIKTADHGPEKRTATTTMGAVPKNARQCVAWYSARVRQDTGSWKTDDHAKISLSVQRRDIAVRDAATQKEASSAFVRADTNCDRTNAVARPWDQNRFCCLPIGLIFARFCLIAQSTHCFSTTWKTPSLWIFTTAMSWCSGQTLPWTVL